MDRNNLVLGKCKTNEGRTIYKNTNEEMVKQIKSIKVSREKFNTFSHKNCHIVQVLNENQNLCIDENGENFVETNKNIDEYVKTTLLEEINKRFNVVDVINESLGEIYTRDGLLVKFIINMEEEYSQVGRMAYSECGAKLSTYDGICLSEVDGEWCSIMFCHLNEDGNIVNRDYNIDLTSLFDNKPINTKRKIIEDIIKEIPDVPYKNNGNKWFAEDFAFVLQDNKGEDKRSKGKVVLELSRYPLKGNGVYGERGGASVKIPKKELVNVGKINILQKVLPLVNETKFGGEKVDITEYLFEKTK